MRLLDVVNGMWAIRDQDLAQIREIYAAHMRGETADLKAVEEKLGRKLDNSDKPYQVINGVGVLCLEGPIAKKMNMMTAVSGGVSTQLFQNHLNDALEDPAVSSVLLYVDSPGGTVDGTQALSTAIRNARGKKPIYALADGTMCSAAYWIASAADKVFISDDTTMVGSIGVIRAHVDRSKAEAMDGIKVTEITAGRYKRMVSEHEPLSEAGRDYIQEGLDKTYAVFLKDVAKNRGITIEKTLAMAEGRVFMGQDAIDIGLVDGMESIQGLVSQLAVNHRGDVMAVSNETSDAGDEASTVGDEPKVSAEVAAAPVVDTPAAVEDVEAPKAPEVVEPAHAQEPEAANGEVMNEFEAYFREALGVSADVSMKAAIDAIAATQKTLADKKGEGYVNLGSFNMKVAECNALTAKLLDAEKSKSKLEKDHKHELAQRDADDMVRGAIEIGKLTPNEAIEWGNEMALENPKMFQKVIDNRPEIVNVERDNERKTVHTSASTKASVEFTASVSQLQKDSREAGKPLSLREAQRQVAEKNPSLYEAASQESNNFNKR